MDFLSKIYKCSDELANFLNEDTAEKDDISGKRASQFSSLRAVTEKRRQLILNNIVNRCGPALHQASLGNVFMRGSQNHSSIQFIKPGLKKRHSRDSWNLWNIIFDSNSKNSHHQKRRYSVYFTRDEDVATEFGDIVYVLPVGNATITYSPDDFIELFPIGALEGNMSSFMHNVIPKSPTMRYISSMFYAGNNIIGISKSLKVLEKICRSHKDVIENIPIPFPVQGRKDLFDGLKSALLEGRSLPFLFSYLVSDRIESVKLSSFDIGRTGHEELWTSSPCYLLEEEYFDQCLKIYNDKQKQNN